MLVAMSLLEVLVLLEPAEEPSAEEAVEELA